MSLTSHAVGVGLRPAHYRALHEQTPDLDYLELRTEHFLGDGQRARRHLARITARYPVVLHGEALNLLGHAPLDEAYLDAVARLADEVDAAFVSDHLSWTAAHGVAHHVHLPVPWTPALADFAAERACYVQRRLGRPFGVANVASYLVFRESTLTEWEFYRRVVANSGCGAVLDLASVYASSVNHGFAASDFLAAVDVRRVLEVQLSGLTRVHGMVVASGDHAVADEVWQLHAAACQRGPVRTLIEPVELTARLRSAA